MKAELKNQTDTHLLESLHHLVREERRITLEILTHLREVERRRLHALRGHASLFDYCVKALGYSESAAYRRISAMRALKETPGLEEAIQEGRLSVSTVSRVQTFLKAVKSSATGNRVGPSDHKALFESLEGKSTREVERALVSIAPEAALPKARERALNAELTELRLVADAALMEKLHRLKSLCSHRLKKPDSWSELFEILANDALKKLDPEAPKETPKGMKSRPENAVAAPEAKAPARAERHGTETRSRYIRKPVRQAVWRKSNGCCTYVDPHSGKKCGSRFRLQIDHQIPFALGGSHDPGNLRLLCVVHNQLAAVQVFGEFARKV